MCGPGQMRQVRSRASAMADVGRRSELSETQPKIDCSRRPAVCSDPLHSQKTSCSASPQSAWQLLPPVSRSQTICENFASMRRRPKAAGTVYGVSKLIWKAVLAIVKRSRITNAPLVLEHSSSSTMLGLRNRKMLVVGRPRSTSAFGA